MEKIELTSPKGNTYTTLSLLGQGQYGKVFLVTDLHNTKYAMKTVDWDKLKIESKLVDLFRTEQQIMESIDHPRILKLHDKIITGNYIHLITTFCDGGNLEDLILNSYTDGLGEKVATNFLIQIAEAFQEMRKVQVIHRDLKLANIFLKNNEVVIGDFGFAKMGVSFTGTKLGTPFYMAPEILDEANKNNYDKKCDIWSIGICYFFLLFGKMPFGNAKNNKELLSMALNNSGARLKIPKKVSFNVQDLLIRLIECDPDKRISFDEFFNHPLINLGSTNRQPKSKSFKHNSGKGGKGYSDNVFNQTRSYKTNDHTKGGSGAQNYFSVSSNNSNISDFNLTHSQISNSHVDVSNQQINESNFPAPLKAYLYNKNIIIFLMDTIKKIKAVEELKSLENLFLHFLIVEMIVYKKAINYTNYIKSSMQNGNNVFGLDNFAQLTQTNEYNTLLTFFTDFEKFIIQLYNKLKSDISLNANNAEQMINKIDSFANENCNKELNTSLTHILKTYRSGSGQLKEGERQLVMQAVIYLFFNNNISAKFPESQFNETRNWMEFCNMLNDKSYTEIEGRMYQFYGLS